MVRRASTLESSSLTSTHVLTHKQNKANKHNEKEHSIKKKELLGQPNKRTFRMGISKPQRAASKAFGELIAEMPLNPMLANFDNSQRQLVLVNSGHDLPREEQFIKDVTKPDGKVKVERNLLDKQRTL